MAGKNGGSSPSLFTPGQLGRYLLPHRIVMAPMTRNRAGEGNVPTGEMARYYRQRASAALIVTEATQVSAGGVGYPSTPGIHTSGQEEGWRRVTEAVHEAGGRIFLQLWHVGRISHPSFLGGELPVAPSAVRPKGEAFTYEGLQPFPTPRALETEEIPGLVDAFLKGAERAKRAEFDGVELHGANGYLVDQFLRDGTNHRTDRYGGSVENRARLLLDITRALVDVWDADRVGVRLSPLSTFNDMFDSDPEKIFTYVAARLGELGVAYLHLVEQNHFSGRPEEFELGAVTRAFGGTVIANGGYDLERGQAAVGSGAADFVAYGKLFLANPDLPRRFELRAPLNEPDPSSFYGGDEHGYTDYPFLSDSEIEGRAASATA